MARFVRRLGLQAPREDCPSMSFRGASRHKGRALSGTLSTLSGRTATLAWLTRTPARPSWSVTSTAGACGPPAGRKRCLSPRNALRFKRNESKRRVTQVRDAPTLLLPLSAAVTPTSELQSLCGRPAELNGPRCCCPDQRDHDGTVPLRRSRSCSAQLIGSADQSPVSVTSALI